MQIWFFIGAATSGANIAALRQDLREFYSMIGGRSSGETGAARSTKTVQDSWGAISLPFPRQLEGKIMKKGLLSITLSALLASFALMPATAKEKAPAKAAPTAVKACKWKTLSFTPALPMSDQGNAGGDRVSFFHPTEVKPDEPRIRVVLAEIDQETYKALNARGTLLNAMVSTIMGLGKDSDGPCKRTFMGEEVTGGIWTADYPPKTLEAYVVNLPSGSHAFVALERTNVIDAAKAETVYASVAKTLSEGK